MASYDLGASPLAVGPREVSPSCTARPVRRTENSVPDSEKPILRVAHGAIERWQTGGRQPYIDARQPIQRGEGHLARRLSR